MQLVDVKMDEEEAKVLVVESVNDDEQQRQQQGDKTSDGDDIIGVANIDNVDTDKKCKKAETETTEIEETMIVEEIEEVADDDDDIEDDKAAAAADDDDDHQQCRAESTPPPEIDAKGLLLQEESLSNDDERDIEVPEKIKKDESPVVVLNQSEDLVNVQKVQEANENNDADITVATTTAAAASEEEEDEEEDAKPESSLLEEALKGHNKETSAESAADSSSNKMEDVVHEGCGDAAQQPSSPGHADQRASEDRRANNNNNNSINAKTSSSADEQDEDEEDDDEESSNLVANITNEKRKNETDDDDSLAVFKKIKGDIHLQECYLRNKVLNDYADAFDAGNANDMDVHVDQLLVEIQNLEDIAKEKEREWNNVIHMKKMKEELLLRVQRQKQVYLLSNGLEISENHDVFGGGGGNRSLMSQQQQQQQKRRLNNNNNNNKSMELLVNGIDGNKGRKGPVRDVQSIIADYRQQHPESVPRRGRRIRNVNGSSGTITNDAKTTTGNNNGGVMNFSSLALGSGARVRQHNVDSSTDVTLFLASGGGDNYPNSVIKDAADVDADQVIFQKKEAFPEVTVHAVQASPPTMTNNVPSSSLLHGILTKSAVKQENSTTSSRTTFSPTLARLLTAPDKTTCNNAQQSNHHHNNSNNKSSNVSISDILNTNKGRSEITITPVGNDYIDDGHQQVQHLKRGKNQMEDETEDSVDRLVIDESNDLTDSRTDNNSDDGAGDEVPQCQGCNQKAAQFVCAGCSNQWYCSRECQVNAWDEHSEMCSG